MGKGIFFGALAVGILWWFVGTQKDQLGYGMAILPLIILSIIIFLVIYFITD